MIREYSRGRGYKDEITEVLGSPFYAQTYYPPGLKERILTPHSTKLVSVSRFYLKLNPQVVVDFEPSPLEGKFWVDEKRRFFWEQGIVYVPVFLGERLTAEQFAARVKQETAAMSLGRQELREDASLRTADVLDTLLSAPDVVQMIDQEVLRRVAALPTAQSGHLHGVAKATAIKRVKREVVAEVRQQAHDGRLGHLLSNQQPAVPAR